mgnify:CR=1 FL=1
MHDDQDLRCDEMEFMMIFFNLMFYVKIFMNITKIHHCKIYYEFKLT